MSFPRYPAYKPSGVEWLGEVPEHWNLCRTDAVLGSCRSTINADALAQRPVFHYSIPVVQETGDGQLEDGSDIDSGKLVVTEPQVLVSKLNPRKGTVCIARPHDVLTVCSSEFVPLLPRSEDIRFLWYIVQSENYRTRLESLVESATKSHQRAAPSDIYRLMWSFPPRMEQSTIAIFLDRETAKIDALIAEQQRLIELLQEQRQAVISHAVTKGLNPDAPMKNSGVEWLGEVPEHWRNFRLKALFALKHGYAFDGSQFSEEGEYALMTPGNFIETGGFRRKDPEKYYVGSDMPSEFILQGGEMLIAMTEQAPGPVGTALIAPEGEHYLHNQRLGLVTRLKAEQLDTSFLYWLMNSPVLKAKVGVTAAGQKVRHTSPQKILDNEICLPPLEEQKIIAQALFEAYERCIKLTENACGSIRLLVERRAALISAAVTGQIDVRGLVPEVEAA
jgi:type I restriction enzyme S subunit